MQGKDNKQQARQKYVFERMNAPVIALLLKVSTSSVRRWKREAKGQGDDWDLARAAQLMTGSGLETIISEVVEDFVVLSQATIEKLKNDEKMGPAEKAKLLTSMADAMNKMVLAAGRVTPKVSELGVAESVLRKLADFIRDRFPEHATAFDEVLEPFGEKLIEAFQGS